MGMKARETFVFDHNESLASSLIDGTMACRHIVYPDIHGANSSHRSRSLLCTCTQGGEAESMGGAPGRAGEPSDGEDLQTHPIGDSVSDSRSVNDVSAKIDHVKNVPTFTFKSSLSSHAVRLAFPIWSLVEISHPRVQLSNCHTALVREKGDRVTLMFRAERPSMLVRLLLNNVVCAITFLPPIYSS